MRHAGAAAERLPSMLAQAETLALALENVERPLAARLRQEMARAGGDVVFRADNVTPPLPAEAEKTVCHGPARRPGGWRPAQPCSRPATAALSSGAASAAEGVCVLLLGPRRVFDAAVARLAGAAEDGRDLATEIRAALDGYARRQFEIPLAHGRIFAVGPQPALMGIVNVTPDSFSDGGQFFSPQAAVEQGLRLAEEGADLLDVGGESTRPGSNPVPEVEELRRVLPVLEHLAARTRVPISIDTRHGRVAREAVAAGACLVNDVTGLRGDPAMAGAVAETGAGLVIMHMLGEPKTMQENPQYEHLMADIARFLRRGLALAQEAGVPQDRILIDPGIGFGKTLAHNVEILARLGQLRTLGRPIIVGPSRKRFIGELTRIPTPAARTYGTAAACAMAVAAGALVLRVHDVAAMRQALAVAAAVTQAAERL
jgi:dihydropteroate synthase